MNIDETNNTVEKFREAIIQAGFILSKNVTDKQIQYILNKQNGKIDFTIDIHDKKTITGYKFIESST
jgi:hypothetical protein